MRTTPILTPALVLVALIAGLLGARGQSFPLVQMTNQSWRYFQSGFQPPNVNGLTWRASNYVDTAWATGFGLFGLETDATYPENINTPLDIIAPGAGTNTISYYFRTHFNFPTNPAGIELNFTMAIDDGVAVYLNGAILFTNRLIANATYGTLAAGRPAPEGTYEFTNIANSSLLQRGDNVLAVEVHQSSTNSSDIIFGLDIDYRFATPIVITKQPKGGLVGIGDPLSLSVEVTGSSPQYQWFRNGAPISGANTATYTVNPATTNNAGTYFVRVFNGISTNNSANAVIQVVPDTFSPVPLTAIVEEGNTNQVLITFDDAISRTFPSNPALAGTNVLNYQVQRVDAPSTLITIRTANPGGSQVRLTVDPNWDPTKEYYITINRILDTSTNMIKPNSQIGINFRVNTNFMPYTVSWKWSGQYESNQPPTWTSTNFVEDPNEWFDGAAPFYYETDGDDTTCMGPIYNGTGNGTQVPNYFTSYYFRKIFIVPTNVNLADTTVRLTYVLDDGALFYLNGTEVYRTNLPSGSIQFNTPALASWEPGLDGCRSNSLPGSVLRYGTNVLAVQVCQGPNPGAEAFDIAFGLSITLSTPVGFDVPALSYRRLTNSVPGPVRLAVDWPGTGWTLQQSSTASTNGPWTTATSTGNSYTNTTGARFFRLKK